MRRKKSIFNERTLSGVFKNMKKTAVLFATIVVFSFYWINFPFMAEIFCFAQTPRFARVTETSRKDLLLSRFTTYFDGANAPRSHNIRLACEKINGTRVSAGKEFSFNETVGPRTKERGFADAAVILEGKFVSGTGGGVCQVSTTLYNAALLAGMGVTEARAHSLQVGYVSPSLDAMVSSGSDMRFVNLTSAPAVVYMYADENSVTAEIYGKNTGYEYRTESVSLCVVEPPPPQVVEGEEDATLRQAKNGLKSESYLVYYRHGKRVKSVRLRRDSYAFVQGLEQRRKASVVDDVKNTEENVVESTEEKTSDDVAADNSTEKAS